MLNVDERKTEDLNHGAKTESQKVVFTPEQQQKVQELIDEAYRKAFQRAKTNSLGGAETEALRKEIEGLKEERKIAAVLRVVAKHNVIDPEEVSEFLCRRVAMDDSGRINVNGDNGGGPIPFEQYVDEWLSERPHHLRGSSSFGAGSQGVRFGGRSSYNLSDHRLWRTMPKEDFERTIKDGVNIQGSGGQVYRFKNNSNPFVEARKARFASASSRQK